VFRAIGPGASAVRVTHDRIAAGAYAAARGSLRAAARAGAGAISVTRPDHARSISDSVGGRLALGALNGMHGDLLRERGSVLATEMTLLAGGRDVFEALDSGAVEATGRVVLFVHGLCETDDAWKLGASRSVPYGTRLRTDHGYTPLYLRYNTGLHVSENGRELSALLERLTRSWPVELHELAVIGHSMGGLVSRSACHYAAERDWVNKVRHVFTLGTPHRGAPLEQAANVASAALALTPETRPFARALNRRSVGIKDLRFGYLVEEDWFGHDCDAFLCNTGSEVPFLPTASHYFVCATVSRDAGAPLGRIAGDLLVLRRSAWSHGGRGERMRFPIEHYTHVGGANHFDLLNHPAIYEVIARWMAGDRGLSAGAAEG
jgi:pimeloyl-ACP methyl ester carboxylesterase